MKTESFSEHLVEMKLLRLFDVLYDTKVLRKAAEELGQSPPTVSIWLSQLRLALRDPLFVRTAKGMLPTPRADELIATVRDVLRAVRSMTDKVIVFDAKAASRTFRVCMTDGGMLTLVPDLIQHLRVTAPQVTLEISKISPSTGSDLEQGYVDVAIGNAPELAAGFYEQPLFDQVWVCLVNSEHPRISTELTIDDFVREDHVNIGYMTGFRDLNTALKLAKVERRVILEIPMYLGVPAVVASGNLIATMPSRTGKVLAQHYGLKIFPCPVPAPSITVNQYWHERFQHDPAHRWLRSEIQTLFLKRADKSDMNL